MTVRVRIAPSPTGDPHVGTAYMALFNYIFAKHHGGKFILRIEDTDRARSKPEYEQNIYEALKWSGLSWDEGPDVGGSFGPYRQSERLDIYKKYAKDLLDRKLAYKCFCTQDELREMREIGAKTGSRAGYDRRCRNLSDEEVKEKEDQQIPYVIRMRVPLKGECVYEDLIKGTISCPWADVDDQVLMKSDGFPTYHLANVVDDHLMKITHVIRGDEWMSSTPKHVFLYEALGLEAPKFMHMPLLLGTDGKKLSKRKNPTSIFFYRDSGYLKEAFLNFLTLMGYSMPSDQEIYSLEEIIQAFDYKRVGVSGAVFDILKLDWINQQYIIKNIPEQMLWTRMKEWAFSDEKMEKIMPLIHTRIKTFGDFIELCSFFFLNHLHYALDAFEAKGLHEESRAMVLQVLLWKLEQAQDFSGDSFNRIGREVAELFGVNFKKSVIPLLFGAIMGKRFGPPLFDSITLLGKDRARARILKAIDHLGGLSKKKLALLEEAYRLGDLSSFAKEGVVTSQ